MRFPSPSRMSTDLTCGHKGSTDGIFDRVLYPSTGIYCKSDG